MLRLKPQQIKKKKQKTQSQGPSQLFHILTACPKRNTVSKNRAHGKQGPPLPPPPIPPLPQRQPSYSSPSSPQTSKTILVQLSKVTALAAFRSVSKLFAPFCLHRICGLTPLFLFSCRPSCDQASPLADTPTAKMIIQQGNNWSKYVFSVKAEKRWLLEKCFSLKKLDWGLSLGGMFGVLWAV